MKLTPKQSSGVSGQLLYPKLRLRRTFYFGLHPRSKLRGIRPCIIKTARCVQFRLQAKNICMRLITPAHAPRMRKNPQASPQRITGNAKNTLSSIIAEKMVVDSPANPPVTNQFRMRPLPALISKWFANICTVEHKMPTTIAIIQELVVNKYSP